MKPEELFRDRLDTLHTVPPQTDWQPESAWGKLASRLSPVPKRKYTWWYAAASVTLLLLLGGYGWYTAYEQQQTIVQLTWQLHQSEKQIAALSKTPKTMAGQPAQSQPSILHVPDEAQQIARTSGQLAKTPSPKKNPAEIPMETHQTVIADHLPSEDTLISQPLHHASKPDSAEPAADPTQLLLAKKLPPNQKRPVFGEVTIVFPGNQPDELHAPVAAQRKFRQKKSFFRFGRNETEPPVQAADTPTGFTARLK